MCQAVAIITNAMRGGNRATTEGHAAANRRNLKTLSAAKEEIETLLNEEACASCANNRTSQMSRTPHGHGK